MKIWHDPQHGGPHRGCEHNGIVEKDWVLKMAAGFLAVTYGFGWTQMLSRVIDIFETYEERASKAKVWGADIAFLHHVNAHDDTNLDGLITFVYPGQPLALDVAKVIGHCAPVELRQRNPAYVTKNSDWTKRADFCLKPYAEQGIPTVLIEWGFSTSLRDVEILTNGLHRPALESALICGASRAQQILPSCRSFAPEVG